ncbi:hypothetical protein A2960_01990 [Candidatus Gottesmanbacteria bacterium RIFCSPLOWO2_01_FULL_39_12b]|uniref:Uncharacterized protein n=1 Tax=Candidatus Gottesmanbacteria bacterium RIFCSPLOWO2_01_FULL_39_12b TaxID=1798388 RepID=A0A1F6AQD6_9BACT|nr:MAG: hypothetical protein A2960_01990 [Candidatus Gottesmanbacteria bacterium RIFCSPLOWO2_01_FULL_39_12b]
MRNWSVDEDYLKKFPLKYKLWRLVQTLSYGLDGEKINKKEVIKYWDRIKDQLDPARRDYVNFLLWGNLS